MNYSNRFIKLLERDKTQKGIQLLNRKQVNLSKSDDVVFQRKPWSHYNHNKLEHIKQQVSELRHQIDEEHINKLVNQLFDEHKIKLLCIADPEKEPCEMQSWGRGTKPENLLLIKLSFKFEGEKALIFINPDSEFHGTFFGAFFPVMIRENTLMYEIIEINKSDASEVAEFANDINLWLQENVTEVNKLAEIFNNNLKSNIQKFINDRLKEIQRQEVLINKIPFKLKKKENIPELLKIELKKTSDQFIEHLNSLPTREEKVYFLDQNSFNKIINDLYVIGQQMERTPSTYSEKHEQDIRDLFWLLLEFNYSLAGLTTSGETFNHNGRTDLLIKYQDIIIFIAELKFWRGQSKLSETLNQLFGYLTWRENEACIIYFIDQKNPSSIINEFDNVIKTQEYFKGISIGEYGRRIVSFEKDCGSINVTFLFFHFPKCF